jgi:hypothetical protein
MPISLSDGSRTSLRQAQVFRPGLTRASCSYRADPDEKTGNRVGGAKRRRFSIAATTRVRRGPVVKVSLTKPIYRFATEGHAVRA